MEKYGDQRRAVPEKFNMAISLLGLQREDFYGIVEAIEKEDVAKLCGHLQHHMNATIGNNKRRRKVVRERVSGNPQLLPLISEQEIKAFNALVKTTGDLERLWL